MTFTKNSSLVSIYVRKINNKEIEFDRVPQLFNLREIVKSLI